MTTRQRALPHDRQSGLTLTELMIAMLLFSMLAAGVMISVFGQQQTTATLQNADTAVDNARSTLNVMARQVRMALAGMANGLVSVADAPKSWHGSAGGVLTDCGNGSVPAVFVLDGGAAASDTLALIYPEGGAWGSLSAPLNESDTTVTVRTYTPPLPAPQVPLALPINSGDWVLVSNLNRAIALQATSNAALGGNDYTFNKTASVAGSFFVNPIATGAFVFKASWLAYRINSSFFGGEDVIEVIDLAPTSANLNTAGSLGEPAATGIEDLQVALGIDGINGLPRDGQIAAVGANFNDDEWVYNVVGDTPPTCADMANLIAVRLTLVARSTSEAQGVRRGRPAVENRAAAGTTDGYYRVVLRQVIALRNKGN